MRKSDPNREINVISFIEILDEIVEFDLAIKRSRRCRLSSVRKEIC